MRHLIAVVLSICVFLSTPFVNNAQTSEPPPTTNHNQMLIQGIKAGDLSAIAEAGKSRDRIFVPHLLAVLSDRSHNDDTTGAVRLALARLGETSQLQDVWCRSITDDPKHGLSPSTYELQAVGGWFGIQALLNLLRPDAIRWHKFSEREKRNDLLTDPIEVTALQALPTLIPNPPEPSADTDWRRNVKQWQDWIAAHKDELSKLQPTGEGVDFSSNACKNGKPRKKH